jgi:trimeric autotransporter adhesin
MHRILSSITLITLLSSLMLQSVFAGPPSPGPGGIPPSGLFSGYFNNIIYVNGTTWVCSAGQALIGFSTGSSTFGQSICGSVASQWTTSGSTIYYNGGNVGIGTANPTTKLEVVGWDALINGVTVGRGGGNIISNMVIGIWALRINTTGNNNTANGSSSLRDNTTGFDSTANGSFSLSKNTTGFRNTAVWSQALWNNTTGFENTTNGAFSLFVNTTGNNNTGNGVFSLNNNTTGNNNTGNGVSSLNNNTTGNNNTAIGTSALSTNTIGNYNIGIWSNSEVNNGTASNQLSIGNLIYGTGMTGAGAGNIGIWVATPTAKLEVAGQVKITGGTPWVGKVLTSDAGGLATWQTPSGITSTNPFYYVTAGNGNGICFWNDCTNYKIHMGIGGEYNYGPVTGYSIKSNMNAIGWWGWTWWAPGIAPVASIEVTTGNMAIAGQMRIAWWSPWVGKVLTSDASGLASWQVGGGGGSIDALSDGYYNTGAANLSLGAPWAFATVTTGLWNVGVGSNSFGNLTSWQGNTALWGIYNLYSVTTGSFNNAIGTYALNLTTIGSSNTAIGANVLQANVAGSRGVAIGENAQAYANNTTTAWTNTNTSVGYQSLRGSATPSANTGNGNTAMGYQTLLNNTSGNANIAIGKSVLIANTTGTENTAIGNEAMESYSIGWGWWQNTAIWNRALRWNTIGYGNTAIGNGSMQYNVSGISNTAVWYYTLIANHGSNNTALGTNAWYGDWWAGNSYNTFIGWDAGRLLGSSASNTYNTFLGQDAGENLTAGSNNLFLGYNTQPNISTTSSNQLNIANLIYGRDATGAGAGNIGIWVANPTEKLHVGGNVLATSYLYTSDRRLKDDITPLTGASDLLSRLEGVSFSWKWDGRSDIGFIAQDVEKVLPQIVHTGNDGMKSVEYGNIVPLLVEGYKSEKSRADGLEKRLEALEVRLEAMERK